MFRRERSIRLCIASDWASALPGISKAMRNTRVGKKLSFPPRLRQEKHKKDTLLFISVILKLRCKGTIKWVKYQIYLSISERKYFQRQLKVQLYKRNAKYIWIFPNLSTFYRRGKDTKKHSYTSYFNPALFRKPVASPWFILILARLPLITENAPPDLDKERFSLCDLVTKYDLG